MADDPYETLGVARDADAAAIRNAYRKLAKKNHPDLNPGDSAAEERFKRISGANALLSDEGLRARYDRGEIDGAGDPRAPAHPRYRDFAEGMAAHGGASGGAPGGGAWQTSGQRAGGWTPDEWGDIFGGMFGERGAGGAGSAAGPRRGHDEHYALAVAFLDAATGATTRLALPDGRTLDVRVPPGIDEGQTLRLRGQGGAGWNGGPAGDALITVHVTPHALFRREGRDIHLDLPITLREAVLGAKVPVPTPAGTVNMTIPPNTESGRQLRLRGRGVAAAGGAEAGDLYVALQIAATEADPALAAFLRGWTPAVPVDPRAALGGEA